MVGDAARLLSEESSRLETRLATVNNELSLAREFIDNSAPVSIALTRQMLWRGVGMTHPMEAHLATRQVCTRRWDRDLPIPVHLPGSGQQQSEVL